MKKTSVVKKAQKGTSVKSVQKRMSSPGVYHGHADNRTEAQRKASAEFQGPNSTYGKRRASIIAQQEDEAMRNKTNRARKDESSYTYRNPFADSPVLKKGNMYAFENPGKTGIANKPNVSKPVATASKKTIKKAGASPKAKKGASVKKSSMGKCRMGC